MTDIDFTAPKRVRRQFKGNTGRLRGGKLYPVMMHAIREGESGVLRQAFKLELDPIPGRLISEMVLEYVTIFAPVQAMDAIKDPGAAYAGMTEVVREKLLGGTLFGGEPEGIISRTAKVNPQSVGGVKYVNEVCRLAYNCAVNMLRQRRYFRAALVPHTNTAILPAIYAQTVLDKINGVLDPDDRVNGSVTLDIGNMPVRGINRTVGAPTGSNPAIMQSTANAYAFSRSGAPTDVLQFEVTSANLSRIYADGSGAVGNLSLQDFYKAETADKFARYMDDLMRENPQYGEEMVLRWAHGLSVDAGRMPFIIAERSVVVNKSLAGAMDSAGVNDDVMRTDGSVTLEVTVPIPRTELGGVIITLVALKPDEKLASQPEPFLSKNWKAQNYVADSLALDPQAVTVRELHSDCAAGVETNVVAYTGLNALRETYVDYGFSRATNLVLVDNKTAIWQIDVPLSVSPTNVNYPDYLDHGVFAYGGTQAAPVDVATFTITSIQSSPTPMIVGPTPVEDIGPNNDNLFPAE